jgi:hypothetical protein
VHDCALRQPAHTPPDIGGVVADLNMLLIGADLPA